MKKERPKKYKVEYMKCECCNKKIVKYPQQRYCTNCAVYIRNLKQRIGSLKIQIDKKNKRIEELKNGERKQLAAIHISQLEK